MTQALNQINWFRERGFLLGRDKPKDIYYVVDSGTGRRYDFNSLKEAEKFVEDAETQRELNKMSKPESCPNLDCRQENRNTCFKCGWYEGNLVIGEELLRIWDNTPTIRKAEEILLLIEKLKTRSSL